MIRKIFYYLFLTVSILLIAISLLSLIQNISFWFLQILDFPRLQYLVLGLICLVAIIAFTRQWNLGNRIVISGLIVSVGIHAFTIFPYTKFASKEAVTYNQEGEGEHLSLLVANVWQKNSNYSEFINMVENKNPDVLIAMEVNSQWLKALSPLHSDYQYSVKKPFDNTYGMALYSKFPLMETKTLYLKNKKVPSIHTMVQVSEEKTFNLHAVHPVPPKPSKHPDNVGEKEIALVKVGNMVANEKLPSVVAGDFNDVAWSKTSRLFKEDGELNDIRVGRGFYNTFNAHSALLRWPLDHVYVTREFKVRAIERLAKIGSDHFPYYVELIL